MRMSCASASPAVAARIIAAAPWKNFIVPPLRTSFGARLRLRAPSDRDVSFDVASLALQPHPRGLSGRQGRDQVQHAGRIGDRLALDLDEDVARLDAGLVGRA